MATNDRAMAAGTHDGGGWRTVVRRAAARCGLLVCGLLGAGIFTTSCTTTPVTGRSAFNLFSPAEDVELGSEAYEEILAGTRQVTSGSDLEMVRRVMNRLAAVADDPGYAWEVRLIDDDQTVNAFALPGGKMAVYTGILPVCRDEAGLAVVMGHEIGHVVAQHGTQRMTAGLGKELVFEFLNIGDYEELARAGLGFIVELPWGRSHESEADHIGLVYMARAGYDPRVAPEFWARMSELGGAGPPEFLSTHPSHETRVENLQRLMPEALAEYEKAGGH